MRVDGLVMRRFEELIAEGKKLYDSRDVERYDDQGEELEYRIDPGFYAGWGTKVQNLLQRVMGTDSAHYKNFTRDFGHSDKYHYNICLGILEAAYEDYKGGYLFNVRALVKAELLSDAHEQAGELLEKGYKDPACVIARVILELALNELCSRNNLPHGKIDRMNADLARQGVYNTAKQKQIVAWADLGNKAAHGKWDEYEQHEVRSFLKGVQWMKETLP